MFYTQALNARWRGNAYKFIHKRKNVYLVTWILGHLVINPLSSDSLLTFCAVCIQAYFSSLYRACRFIIKLIRLFLLCATDTLTIVISFQRAFLFIKYHVEACGRGFISDVWPGPFFFSQHIPFITAGATSSTLTRFYLCPSRWTTGWRRTAEAATASQIVQVWKLEKRKILFGVYLMG